MASSQDLRLQHDRHLRWRVLVIVLAICGLTASLSTRTFRLTSASTPTVQSGSAQAIRQHMDRDAVNWTSPVPTSTTLPVPAFYPRFAPAGPPMPSVLFDESLSNRPPPAC